MTTQTRPAALPRISAYRRFTLGSLFTKSIADRLFLAVGIGIGLALMGVWMGPMFATLDLDALASGFPEAMTKIFGDVSSPTGWFNTEMYSIFAPALLVYVALASAAKAIASEEEDRSIGLLAANPLSRDRILLEKWAAMVVHVAIVAVLSGLGVLAGILVADLDIPAADVAAISLHMLLLGVWIGTVTTLLSALTGRRVLSMIASAGVALVAYAWATFIPLSADFEGWAVVSPWHWYFGSDPLANGADWGYLGLLALASAVTLLFSVWAYRTRDFPG